MPYSMACHIVWHFFKIYFFAEAFIIINWNEKKDDNYGK